MKPRGSCQPEDVGEVQQQEQYAVRHRYHTGDALQDLRRATLAPSKERHGAALAAPESHEANYRPSQTEKQVVRGRHDAKTTPTVRAGAA